MRGISPNAWLKTLPTLRLSGFTPTLRKATCINREAHRYTVSRDEVSAHARGQPRAPTQRWLPAGYTCSQLEDARNGGTSDHATTRACSTRTLFLVWSHSQGETLRLVRTGKKLRRTLLDLMSRELRPPLTIRAKALAMQSCGTAKTIQGSAQGEIGSYQII
jgi:hypothetical protein